MLKKTPLFDEHIKLKGRMVDFGGWELPVQYSGVLAEHTAVRTACGLFDVSHMGEIEVSGPGSAAFLDYVTTNSINTLAIHQAQYSALCNQGGGIVDDLVIYRVESEKYLLVVNASNTDKDFTHLSTALSEYTGVKPSLKNVSNHYAQIAIQGPKASAILQLATDVDLSKLNTYWCVPGPVGGAPSLIARTGYTGEDGFELYLNPKDAPKVWNLLLELGNGFGILPCGLGARDTLRLEMKYALYGHELTDSTNPLEVGLGWITKLSKPDFIGKASIEKAKSIGLRHSLVGIHSSLRGIPRQGYEVFASDRATLIGSVTSGTQSPSLKKSIAIAFIDKSHEKPGTPVFVKIRDDLQEFTVCKTPFITKEKP